MQSRDETRVTEQRRAGVPRRAVVGGAAWLAPAVVVATAAPARAASVPPCSPVRLVADWSSASFVRTSATSATYTWANPLGNGSIPVLTMSIAAAAVGPAFSSIAAGDLTSTPAPIGGQSVDGLDLSLDLLQNTTNLTNTGADYTFTFSRAVTNVAFTIADIDGVYFNATSTNAGAERVFLTSPSPISGTVADSAYLTGTGTSPDPWRRRPNSTPNLLNLPQTSSSGNVAVTSAALSQFSLGYRLLENSTPKPSTYNVFVTPISFTVLCP